MCDKRAFKRVSALEYVAYYECNFSEVEIRCKLRPAAFSITGYLPFPAGEYHSWPSSHPKQHSTQLNSFDGGLRGKDGGGGKMRGALTME